jgi:hypothetical protein
MPTSAERARLSSSRTTLQHPGPPRRLASTKAQLGNHSAESMLQHPHTNPAMATQAAMTSAHATHNARTNKTTNDARVFQHAYPCDSTSMPTDKAIRHRDAPEPRPHSDQLHHTPIRPDTHGTSSTTRRSHTHSVRAHSPRAGAALTATHMAEWVPRMTCEVILMTTNAAISLTCRRQPHLRVCDRTHTVSVHVANVLLLHTQQHTWRSG